MKKETRNLSKVKLFFGLTILLGFVFSSNVKAEELTSRPEPETIHEKVEKAIKNKKSEPYFPVPLSNKGLLVGSVINTLLWGPQTAFRGFALQRTVRATAAIINQPFKKDLNWRQKLYGMAYYSTYYVYTAAWIASELYLNNQRFYSHSEEPSMTREDIFEEMSSYADIDEVTNDDFGFNRLYRNASLIHHPDRGGSVDSMQNINSLRDAYFDI